MEKKSVVMDKKNWDSLLKQISQNKLSAKEINVLRIFFTFLNMQNTYDSETPIFLKLVMNQIKKNANSLSKLTNVE